ncbi:hypothetical protein D049_3768B, partial [Vibrio parahaemolyticus VPTS-2010]
LSQSGRL